MASSAYRSHQHHGGLVTGCRSPRCKELGCNDRPCLQHGHPHPAPLSDSHGPPQEHCTHQAMSYSDAAEKLIHAFVISRLHHCNGLLIGAHATSLRKLQRVSNTAARILTGTRKHEHVTPVLLQLHWLPVEYFVQYKIILLTYKALYG